MTMQLEALEQLDHCVSRGKRVGFTGMVSEYWPSMRALMRKGLVSNSPAVPGARCSYHVTIDGHRVLDGVKAERRRVRQNRRRS